VTPPAARSVSGFAWLAVVVLAGWSVGVQSKEPDVSGFDDAVHHFQLKRDASYARYSRDDVRAIADNLLLLQRDHGGWVQNQDPLRVLDAASRERLLAEKQRPEGSFDNRNVYTQVAYLAAAAEQLHEARYRDAALRGLSYLLRYQLEGCGGWPHSVPAGAAYQARLTVADEVFSGPLHLLRAIAAGTAPYAAFPTDVRRSAEEALQRGEECLLRLQVRQSGVLTGWAGQYDPVTLQPAGGRSFELPALVVQESVGIVRYLLTIPEPGPAVVASVEAAARWLEAAALAGVRLERVTLPAVVEYPHHRATDDVRLTADPAAPPLWPRFADLGDNSVVLANRDGRRVKDFSEVDPERRTGYAWYGEWPRRLLGEELPAWRRQHHLTRPVD
jgi:PelA/Pel-15E family pectate lyase